MIGGAMHLFASEPSIRWAPSVVERTTAVTDALLTLAAVAGVRYLRRTTPAGSARHLWELALATLGAGAVLGVVVHALALGEAERAALWRPLNVLIVSTIALSIVGAVTDWRGPTAARRAGPLIVGIAIAGQLAADMFPALGVTLASIKGAAVIFLVVVYAALALGRRLTGASRLAGAFAMAASAGVLQMDPTLSLRLIWPLDHNGIFHLLQLAALPLQLGGLRAILATAPSGANNNR